MRGALSSRDVTSFTATGATSPAEAALAAGESRLRLGVAAAASQGNRQGNQGRHDAVS